MPNIGEIKYGREIGIKSPNAKFIWQACKLCGKERWVRFINGKAIYFRCNICHNKDQGNKQRGASNPRWKGGKHQTKDGYIKLWLDPNDFFYPMAGRDGYVLEHRLVVAKALNRCLQSWEIVHHKGQRYIGIENRSDNRYPENLELTIRGNHSKEHSKGYRDGYRKGYADAQSIKIKELKREIRLLKKAIQES